MSLVLIHGSGCNATYWDRVRSHLFGIPTFAPTLPGRERVPPLDGPHTIPSLGTATLEMMDEQGIDRATIAGHSLGGAVALWIALEHPDRVLGLGLLNTGARLRVLKDVLEALADGVRDVMDGIVASNSTEHTSDRDRVTLLRMLTATGHEQTFKDLNACDGFDVMERVHEIDKPTLIVGGDQDRVTLPKYSTYLAERIAGSRLVMMKGVGHLLPLERSEELAGELAVLWGSSMPRTAAQASRLAATGKL
ncbi:MAG: alpha/beta fold hydrolase [Actinomycetota bacterium]